MASYSRMFYCILFLTIGLTSISLIKEGYAVSTSANPVIGVGTFNAKLIIEVNLINADEDVTDETGNNIDMSNFRFRVGGNIPSTPDIFEGSEGLTRQLFEVLFQNAGQYNILVEFIDRDDEGNEIDVTDITNDDAVTRSEGCSNTININENGACSIQIDVDQISGAESEGGCIGLNCPGDSTQREEIGVNEEVLPENVVVESESGVIGDTIQKGVLPVDVCISQSKPATVTLPDKSQKKVTLDLVPISATYNFQGTVSINAIKELLRINDIGIDPTSTDKGRQIIFDIQFDNNVADGVKLTPVDSSLRAKIYTKLFPFNDKETGFELRQIWTDCYYPSVVEASASYDKSDESQGSDKKLVVLADDKETPSTKVEIPTDGEDRLFNYATRNSGLKPLTKSDTGAIINPPFSVCSNVIGSSNIDASGRFDPTEENIKVTNENVISKYTIRSIIDKSDLENWGDRETVLLRVTVDTAPQDQARIGDNNNNFVKVQLIIDPKQKDTEVINLGLQEISTNCLGVSYSDSLVQEL